MTIRYYKRCLEALDHCQKLINHIKEKATCSTFRTKKILEESARICTGTFQAIKNNSINASRMALLCVGICEECAETCESVDDTEFQQCAIACRKCSETIMGLAIQGL